MISKELLQIVLKDTIYLTSGFIRKVGDITEGIDGKRLHYFTDINQKSINVYELMHLCKIKAREESFYLTSGFSSDNTIDPMCDEADCYVNQLIFDGEPKEKRVAVIGDTDEVKAVITACEKFLIKDN